MASVDREGVQALIDAAEGTEVRKLLYTSYSGNQTAMLGLLPDASRPGRIRLLHDGAVGPLATLVGGSSGSGHRAEDVVSPG